MASSEEIAQQRGLLEIHRRNLAQYLRQRAQFGDAYVPPVINNGILEERKNIARVKRNLRDWNITVADYPDDEEPNVSEELAKNERSGPSSQSRSQQTTAGTVINNYGTYNERPQNMGNTYNVSGITGSNVNIGSTLTNVNQTIGGMPIDQAAKDELTRLFEQLQAELARAPAENKADAEEAAKRANAAAEAAAKPQPDKGDVEYNLGRFQKAAENIGALATTVLPIANAIAKQIMSIVAG